MVIKVYEKQENMEGLSELKQWNDDLLYNYV